MARKSLVTFDFPSAPTVGGATTWYVKPDGSNASGTWGISISGNAATVTDGLYTTGGTLSGRILVNGTGNIVYENDNGVYIPRPQNATYRTTTASVTGALAVQLPTSLYNGASDMISFWVDIYDYATNESVSLYVFGYIYNSAGQWVNCGATLLTSNASKDFTVRFCHDGTRPIVCIGEVGSTWDYPQVTVRDFQAGFTAAANNSDDGWAITFLTVLPTVVQTATGNLVVAKSATTATTASAVAWSGVTGKPTTVAGYGITDGEFRHANGVPRSNLGDPTVREMAVFDAQFGNKTDRTDIANVTFETSTDGTTWTNYVVSDTEKRRFVGGDITLSNVVIPNGTPYFRVKFRAVGYSYLNALYSYFSTNGNTTQVTVWRKHDSGSLEQHTNSTTNVSSWPGHLYLPFTTIAFNQNATLGTHHHEVYAVFTPTWNNANNINLYNMSWWGGYPAGRRNLYTTDEFGNAVFPAAVSGSTAAVGTNTTQLATTAFVNAEIANDAPTKTGGGASGTWGINISGNATTSSSTDLVKVADNRAVDDAPSSFTQQRIRYDFKNRTAVGNPPSTPNGTTSYAYIATHNHWIGFDGGGGAAVQLNYGTEIDLRYATSASAWSAWKTLLSSTNFNSYAPTLTGTGASGSWGINITGSAASITGVYSGTLTSGQVTTALGYTPQGALTLTTTGTSGAATLVGNTLNIPNYATGGGSGTVTSVALSLPSIFSVSGSPVTTSGTLTADLASQTANYVWAAPNGSAGAPVFRALVAADIPTLNQNTTGSAGSVAWSGVTGKPTTISGYGITDTVTQTITGYTLGTNTAVADTDTIISAFGKVQAQLNAKGVGSVTSVALSLPADFSVTGSPVTGSGTLTAAWANVAASGTSGKVFAGPVAGSAAPTFRVLLSDDIPSLPISKTTNLQTSLDAKAPLASPTFTGTPAAPTAAVGTNTTQLATTAFVQAEIANDAVLLSGNQTVAGDKTFSGTTALAAGSTMAGAVIGYRDIPITVTNAAYTFALADAGKGFGKDAATAYTYTIPANGTVAFPVGTAITVFNNNATANVTIAINTDTLRLGGTTTTGSRTLAPFGVCTLLKVSSTTWIASGSGLT